jgi:hypothetical protein
MAGDPALTGAAIGIILIWIAAIALPIAMIIGFFTIVSRLGRIIAELKSLQAFLRYTHEYDKWRHEHGTPADAPPPARLE